MWNLDVADFHIAARPSSCSRTCHLFPSSSYQSRSRHEFDSDQGRDVSTAWDGSSLVSLEYPTAAPGRKVLLIQSTARISRPSPAPVVCDCPSLSKESLRIFRAFPIPPCHINCSLDTMQHQTCRLVDCTLGFIHKCVNEYGWFSCFASASCLLHSWFRRRQPSFTRSAYALAGLSFMVLTGQPAWLVQPVLSGVTSGVGTGFGVRRKIFGFPCFDNFI